MFKREDNGKQDWKIKPPSTLSVSFMKIQGGHSYGSPLPTPIAAVL